MGTVYNRGTKHKPKWWVGYKERDGEWSYKPSHQPTKEQARAFLSKLESNVAAGLAGIEQRTEAQLCGPLFDRWSDTLSNRNARDDRYRLENHLRPAFGGTNVRDVDLKAILGWLEAQKQGKAPRKEKPGKAPEPAPVALADGKKRPGPKPKPKAPKPTKEKPARLSDASMRHNLNLLSRFMAWCVEQGHAPHNPVRDIPQGRRPTQAAKHAQPWLDDDGTVLALMRELHSPIDLMFYIANRAGLRTGEVAGLRMADVASLADGAIRVRYSYDGPLKEDKAGAGKVKWAPAPLDAEKVLGAHLKQRRAAKAKPEDYLFPAPSLVAKEPSVAVSKERHYRKEFIEQCWEAASKALGVELTWYQATRHSFVSRNLSRGASLDEVSGAVGHSSPVVTRRYYDHLIRKTFSDGLRAGLPADPS